MVPLAAIHPYQFNFIESIDTYSIARYFYFPGIQANLGDHGKHSLQNEQTNNLCGKQRELLVGGNAASTKFAAAFIATKSLRSDRPKSSLDTTSATNNEAADALSRVPQRSPDEEKEGLPSRKYSSPLLSAVLNLTNAEIPPLNQRQHLWA